MTPQEIAQIIALARRAPLVNMAEAEAARALLQKLAAEHVPKCEEAPATGEASDAPA